MGRSAAGGADGDVGSNDGAGDVNRIDGARDAPWLTVEEMKCWVGLNGVLIKLPGLLDGQLQRDADLTYFEYMVLAMLSEQPSTRLRMSRLAVLTNGSLSRLSHVAKRLERAGLITRETDTVDRRSTNAILTAAGLSRVRDAAPGHVANVRDLVIDRLTPEQLHQLTAIGDAILQRIDPEGTSRPVESEPSPGRR